MSFVALERSKDIMQTALTTSAPPSFSSFAATIPGRIILGIAATAVLAASAHIVFPLPFTPIPFILTPLAVLGVGLAFGPTAGFFVLLAYLAEGVAGLPVFAPTPPVGGLAHLLGPSGGFLMSYPLVAAIVGGLTRKLQTRMSRFTAAAIAGTVASVFLILCGALWLSALAHLTPHQTWTHAIAPFLPGEAVKVICAAGIYSTLKRHRETVSAQN